MPNEYNYFSDADVKRIAESVRKTERDKFKQDAGARRAIPPQGFLAILTSSYSSGYDWQALKIANDLTSAGFSAWGSSSTSAKAVHIDGCQAFQSGQKVRMLSDNYLFEPIGSTMKRTMTTSTISAGLGDNSSYGTGTVTTYGTVHNYFSQSIDSGTFVYIDLVGGQYQIIAADCA